MFHLSLFASLGVAAPLEYFLTGLITLAVFSGVLWAVVFLLAWGWKVFAIALAATVSGSGAAFVLFGERTDQRGGEIVVLSWFVGYLCGVVTGGSVRVRYQTNKEQAKVGSAKGE